MATDLKKLMRGALEPARVFGRRDFDPKAALPVLHYSHNGTDYWSPGYPTWMVIDGDCKVLERAIQRYDMREAPVHAGWQEWGDRLFVLPVIPDWGNTLPEPEDYELANGVVFAGYDLEPKWGKVFPATPIAYAQRRFGEGLSYRVSGDFLQVILEGKVVVVVRALAPDSVKKWYAASEAA